MKQDKSFLRPTAITSWGIASDRVIDVSAVCTRRAVFNVYSHLLGYYNKRRWLQWRMTSLHSINCFGYAETFKIPSDPSGMIAIYIALIFFFSSNTPVRVPPSEPDVKWNTWSFVSCICVQFFYASRAIRQRHFKTSSTGHENDLRWACKWLLDEELSSISWRKPRNSSWRREILRNLKPTRKSVLTNKHYCISKVKFKVNAEHKNYDQRPRFWK